MRKGLLIITFIALAITSFANDEKIESVVRQWNEVHNTPDANGLKSLLAEDVLYYGRKKSSSFIINAKTKLLAKGFSQEIISPITLTYYSSGTIKCDFTKRTYSDKGTKEHLCYLLIKEINGSYKITGESDALTDQNKNVQLNLGDVVMSPDEKAGAWIFVILLTGLIITTGMIVVNKRRNKRKAYKRMIHETVSDPILPVAEETKSKLFSTEFIKEEIKATIKEELSSFKTKDSKDDGAGALFEKFISQKFDMQSFQLIEWRSDKFHNGVYAKSNHLPDMEWEIVHPLARKGRFAIECKYRSGYFNGGIELAKDYQFKNYKEYERKARVPVFIVLGVGGRPDSPDELFVIPLKNLNSNFINTWNLKQYAKRKVDGTFFYNSDRKELI